jgi:Protein of unknown function (DUF3107)
LQHKVIANLGRTDSSTSDREGIASMEVRIGVVHTPKELTLEIDENVDDALKTVDKALKSGEAMVWLTDSKGRRVGIALEKLAYIEVESEEGAKRVGFGSI